MLRDLLTDSLFTRRVLGYLFGTVFVVIAFPTLLEIIFANEDEISYSAGAGLSTCSEFFNDNEAALANCTTPFILRIGNTGMNFQERVEVRLSPVPAYIGLSKSSQDIVATARRAENPDIIENHTAESLHFIINDLAANKLVEILLVTRGAENGRALENITVTFTANGTVIESNPRLTVLARFARNVIGIF